MNEQDIREAIKHIESTEFDKYTEAEIQVLIDLAQSVLDAKMPEKKEQSDFSSNPSICFENKGYNQAIDDCRLYQAKKMLGLEEVIESSTHSVVCEQDIKTIATAIRKHLEE